MNILILGSGGREHAIAWKIKQSNSVNKLFLAPGNAGTKEVAENLSISPSNFDDVAKTIKAHKIGMLIVGPEAPLVDGIVDYLEKNNINVFGPNKLASQLEGSKIFTKNLCKKYKIPTANFGVSNSIKTF